MTSPNPTTRVDPVALILLIGSVAIMGANSLALGPISPGITGQLGTTVIEVLQASVCYGVGIAFSAFILARQIDRFGAAVFRGYTAVLPISR